MAFQVVIPQISSPDVRGPQVEKRARDYVTLLHNIAHSNRWRLEWVCALRVLRLLSHRSRLSHQSETQIRHSGRVTWQATAISEYCRHRRCLGLHAKLSLALSRQRCMWFWEWF